MYLLFSLPRVLSIYILFTHPRVSRSSSFAHNYCSYAGLCFFFAESGSLVLEIERRYRQTDDKRSNWPRITMWVGVAFVIAVAVTVAVWLQNLLAVVALLPLVARCPLPLGIHLSRRIAYACNWQKAMNFPRQVHANSAPSLQVLLLFLSLSSALCLCCPFSWHLPVAGSPLFGSVL